MTSHVIYVAMVTILTTHVVFARRQDLKHFKETPKRCCSVDQWEADIRLVGTTTRLRDPEQKISGRMVYDYTNQRWAAEIRDSRDSQKDQRMVFDHNKNRKYAITNAGCVAVELNQTNMDPYCVPNNATHHGYYESVVSDVTIGYDVWSYEVFLRPIRALMRMSAPRQQDGRCVPMQESAYTLVRNFFSWDEGEKPCNPWRESERAHSGDCFMSHVKRSVETSGTRPAAFYTNLDYRNINTTISSTEIFRIPEDCQTMEDWPDHVSQNEVWGMIVIRRKTD